MKKQAIQGILTVAPYQFKNSLFAFTLLELVIVIIIIGVLASLALPRLFSMVKYSKSAEAIAMFGTMRRGFEKCLLMNNNEFFYCSGAWGTPTSFGYAGFMDTWTRQLGIENPNQGSSNFIYEHGSIAGGRGIEVVARLKNEDGTADNDNNVRAWFCGNGEFTIRGSGVFSPLGEYIPPQEACN